MSGRAWYVFALTGHFAHNLRLPQHNKLKEYKHTVDRLRKELKEAKEQAIAARARYTDWNKELQDRVAGLRTEKKAWTAEAAAMRAAEKEAKVGRA